MLTYSDGDDGGSTGDDLKIYLLVFNIPLFCSNEDGYTKNYGSLFLTSQKLTNG